MKWVERTGFDIWEKMEVRTHFYLDYIVKIKAGTACKIIHVFIPADLPNKLIKKKVIKEALETFEWYYPKARVEEIEAEFAEGCYFAGLVINIKPRPPLRIKVKL